ncbi:MAG: hypothetical protein CMJ59_12405 [Planctomycetaceae bacterium]|nr:hypothetical protein [Planctomycetaceae bacterium]
MTPPNSACNSFSRLTSRRQHLGEMMCAATGGLVGLSGIAQPSIASALEQNAKRVLMVYLSGGISQFESWDPKRGATTGGPFHSIASSVPGTHVGELIPHTAQQLHHLTLIRSLSTPEVEHGRGYYYVHTGHSGSPSANWADPALGSMIAKRMAADEDPLPYVHITPEGGGGFGKGDASILGARFGPVHLVDGKLPANTSRPGSLSARGERQRDKLRNSANRRFLKRRTRTAETEAYSYSFEQAARLMERKEIFGADRATAKDRERYGTHEFGRHCLLARQLIEHGLLFVKVTHTNYDSHCENFSFHVQKLAEFDRPFAALIRDLAERGMLEDTLVVVTSEFGRTPSINYNYGRDHYGKCWSIVVGGCGIARGAVYGRSDPRGWEATENQVNLAQVFHTYFAALGINSHQQFVVDGRPVAVADLAESAIPEILL